MSIFCGGETKLQVGENVNSTTPQRLKGYDYNSAVYIIIKGDIKSLVYPTRRS